MRRSLHPEKEVEAALRHAESLGWRVMPGGPHIWGHMSCPNRQGACRCGEFSVTGIWLAPPEAGHHACALRRVADNCSDVVVDRIAAKKE